MHIVFFVHPDFVKSQSMPRFASFLKNGMQQKGHSVEVWSPEAKFYIFPVAALKKWLGYVDQYLIFPQTVKRKLKQNKFQTLFVFTDQALGPWVPLIKGLPHIIHCHDFLAQRSALGEIKENPTGFTGRKYQSYIRRGYQQGKNFISVSENTRNDLHKFLGFEPVISEVVYNGLNNDFRLLDLGSCREKLSYELNRDLSNGFIIHIGGNQWYKNRPGVIKVYNAWRKTSTKTLPLLMIGTNPDNKLLKSYNSSPYLKDILFVTGKNDSFINMAYCGASVLLFPSLAEGFGWPIAEAMACGCPVITTGDAPMTEVGSDAAYYIKRMPTDDNMADRWANESAIVLDKILALSLPERDALKHKGLKNAERFNAGETLDKIEAIYKRII